MAREAHAHAGLTDGDSPALRDRATRAAIAETSGVFDAAAMTGLWEAALDAPGWAGPQLWFHGDFHTGNLLTLGGRVSAVIDFGGLGVGDPSRDLTVAFSRPPGRLGAGRVGAGSWGVLLPLGA